MSVVAASFEMGASDLSGVQVSKLAMCAGIVGPVLRFETRRTASTRYEPAYVASDVGIDLRAEDETIVPVGVVGTARIYSSRCSVLLSYRATAAIGALSGCFAVGVDGMVPVVSDKANDEASERATARQLCLDPAMELQFSGTLLRRQRGFRRWLLEPCFALSRAGHLLEGAHSARRLGRVLGEPTAFFPLLFSASSALKLYWTVVLWRDDCFDSNEWFEDALVRRQTVATVLERVRTMQRRVRRELPRHLWPELWVLAHRDTLSAWLDSLCIFCSDESGSDDSGSDESGSDKGGLGESGFCSALTTSTHPFGDEQDDGSSEAGMWHLHTPVGSLLCISAARVAECEDIGQCKDFGQQQDVRRQPCSSSAESPKPLVFDLPAASWGSCMRQCASVPPAYAALALFLGWSA
ncbi:MAG: hypothetical protein P8104_10825, partial [Gammaproteobacteria bacterium]